MYDYVEYTLTFHYISTAISSCICVLCVQYNMLYTSLCLPSLLAKMMRSSYSLSSGLKSNSSSNILGSICIYIL